MYKLKIYLSDIPDEKPNDMKNIKVKVTEPEEIQKLKNILKIYQTEQKISIPLTITKEYIELKLLTPKLSNYLSSHFSKLTPKQWNGYTATINFNIKKYHFKNKDISKGQLDYEIHGLNFYLKKLE